MSALTSSEGKMPVPFQVLWNAEVDLEFGERFPA